MGEQPPRTDPVMPGRSLIALSSSTCFVTAYLQLPFSGRSSLPGPGRWEGEDHTIPVPFCPQMRVLNNRQHTWSQLSLSMNARQITPLYKHMFQDCNIYACPDFINICFSNSLPCLVPPIPAVSIHYYSIGKTVIQEFLHWDVYQTVAAARHQHFICMNMRVCIL